MHTYCTWGKTPHTLIRIHQMCFFLMANMGESTMMSSRTMSPNDYDDDWQPEMSIQTRNTYNVGTYARCRRKSSSKPAIFDHVAFEQSVLKWLQQELTAENGKMATKLEVLISLKLQKTRLKFWWHYSCQNCKYLIGQHMIELWW